MENYFYEDFVIFIEIAKCNFYNEFIFYKFLYLCKINIYKKYNNYNNIVLKNGRSFLYICLKY